MEKRTQVIGDLPTPFGPRGYMPFCGDSFMVSRNAMAVWIVKPDPANGTDEWLEGAVPETLYGRTWWVKRIPAQDLSVVGKISAPIERWTLKIPDTPYWLHLTFSASLNHSILLHRAEHDYLLGLFHRIVDSVRLEPITPVGPESMPPIQFLPPPRFGPAGAAPPDVSGLPKAARRDWKKD